MTDRRPAEEDPLVRTFLRESDPPSAGPLAGACPDALALAGMAEGRLLEADREGVERHLAGCADCRAVVASLARETTAAERVPALRPSRLPWVVAAAALAASLLLLLGRGAGREEPLATEPALVGTVARLAHEHPDAFGDFRPLTSAERLSPPSPALRGGPRLVSPGSTVLEPRPAFRWDPMPGVTEWAVTVREADGTTLWSSTATGSPHPYPSGERDLPRDATYLWELRARGPLGETSEQRGFRVADEAGVRTYERARALIAESAPPHLRALLLAQYAFRRGLYVEAERAIREFLGGSPTDELGRETAYAVLRAQGSSEAAEFAPRGGGR